MRQKSIPTYRIFSILLLAFLAGVFISSFFQLDFYQIYQVAIILTLLIMAFGLIFKEHFTGVIAASAIIFLVGLLLFSYRNTKFNNILLPFGEEREFQGVVASYPDVSGNSQSFYLETTNFGKSVKIYIKTSRYPAYFYGDELEIKAKIQKPTNFSDFDWVSHLKRFNTVATTSNNPAIIQVSSGKGNKIIEKLFLFRRLFEATVQKTLPEPESSLGIGILSGSKQGFSPELLNDFSRVGISHIIALSGYNVTIIIIFLTDILIGHFRRRQIFFISLALILLFIAMTGAASSVIRAAIITLLIAYGKTIGRRADMTNLILFSAAVMVALNPFVLRFDKGFQLSFLAFIGLIYLSPMIEKFFSRRFLKHLPKFAKLAATETLSAQIAVLPLIISSFGLVSLIAPLTNILILPVIPASMGFVFLATLIYWIVPQIGHIAFLVAYLPLKYVLIITKYSAIIPLSAVQISGKWQTLVIMAYIAVIMTMYIKFKKENATKVN